MSTPSSTIRTSARSLAVPVAVALALAAIAVVVPVAGAGLERSRSIEGRTASVTLPTGNTVEQWNKIAEDTVVGSGAFQIEAFIYMSYESTAVYDATVALQGGQKPLLPAFRVRRRPRPTRQLSRPPTARSPHYFPAASATLDPALCGGARCDPGRPGQARRPESVWRRPTRSSAPAPATADDADRLDVDLPDTHAGSRGVAADAPAFLGRRPRGSANVHPFVLERRPVPPRSAAVAVESDWVTAFNELKTYGSATSTARTAMRRTSPNSGRRTSLDSNRVVRDITDAKASPRPDRPARRDGLRRRRRRRDLVLFANYHYLFWRPVTAIDPTAVTADGFGPRPDSTTATQPRSSNRAGGRC